MYYILETLFLVGVGVLLLALLWFLSNLFRSRKQYLFPFFLAMIGGVIALSPVMYTRIVSTVDLGERERIVDGELHLTLTGWDRKGYEFLAYKPEIVVLQMANGDVTDETLDYLKSQTKLKTLDVNGSQITDAGLTVLSQLKSLQTLRLRGARISDAGLKNLLASLPDLKQLDLQQTKISQELTDSWKNEKPGRRVLR